MILNSPPPPPFLIEDDAVAPVWCWASLESSPLCGTSLSFSCGKRRGLLIPPRPDWLHVFASPALFWALFPAPSTSSSACFAPSSLSGPEPSDSAPYLGWILPSCRNLPPLLGALSPQWACLSEQQLDSREYCFPPPAPCLLGSSASLCCCCPGDEYVGVPPIFLKYNMQTEKVNFSH